jgi:ribosomal-protein-alanine N-acetyltransferase
VNFTDLPVIATERLLLRAITINDVADIFAFTSNPITSEWLSWYPHQTPADTAGFVSSVLAKYEANTPAQWVIADKQDGKVIGICGFVNFSAYDENAEVAYVVSPDYWGRGILTEALTAIIQWAFAHGGLSRIEARCEVGNVASERAMQKAGLRLEGECIKFLKRKGALRDYRLYAITR